MATATIWRLGTLLGIAVVAFFPVFAGRFYAIGDMRDVYMPLELFFQQEMRAGHIPAWNPDIAWGFPVIASAQIGFFYPPLLITRWLLPIWIYLPLILVGHVIAAGVGLYLFLRRQAVSSPGALLGAAAFALSAFLWQHLYHLNIIIALAWFPWQMIAAERAAAEKRTVKKVVLLALVFGLPFLAGQLQMPLLMAAVAAIYFLYLTCQTPIIPITIQKINHYSRPLFVIFIAAVLAFFIASPQLLPTLELLRYSSRNSAEGFDVVRANQHSYPVYHVPTLMFPRFFGSDYTYWGKRLEVEYGFYIGVIPLLLAVWVIFQHSKLKVTHSKFFKALLIISFLLALGGLSPFRLIGIEPSLWVFSAPARWLFFTTFVLALFAAHGWDALADKEHRHRFKRFAAYAACVIGAGVVAANILLHSVRLEPVLTFSDEYATQKIHSLLASARSSSVSLLSPFTFLPLISMVALPLVLTRQRGMHVLIVLTIAELLLFASTAMPTISWQEALAIPDTVRELPATVRAKQARMYSIRDGGDTGAYFTDPESRADDAMRATQRRLLLPLLHAQFGIAGIEWPASLDLQQQEDALGQLRETGGYAIENIALAQDLNIAAVASEADGKIVIEEIPAAPRAEIFGEDTPATYQEVSPQHVRIAFETAQATTLIVRDTLLPGWQATLNGQPVPLTLREPFFRAVSVPAGAQVVEMKYVPYWIYVGMALSLLTGAACMIVWTRSKTP